MYGSPQFSTPTSMPQFNYHQDIDGRTPDRTRRQFQNQYHSHREEHWCETCDRGFQTTEILDKHKQQHQKCNIDGCQFIAHPKVITKHIQMQHASGLYKKIANINNPEEIKKWREERKKKYPTKKNIEKKEAERQARIDRGEKIGLKSQRFEKKNTTGGNNKRKSGITRENHQNKRHKLQTTSNSKAADNKRPEEQNTFNTNKSKLPKQNNYVPVIDTLFKLKPFAGIRDIILEYAEDETEQNIDNLVLTDDDDDCKLTTDVNEDKQALTHPKVCGALSSLICNYESSEEESMDTDSKKNLKITSDNVTTSKSQESKQSKDNDSGPEEVKITSDNVTTSKSQESKQSKDNDSGPEEVKITKNKDVIDVISVHNNIESLNSNKFKKEHTGRSIKKSNFSKSKPKIPSTLLQKLLHTEIQHERNIVLQCIRHIVKNNFFDK